MKNKAIIDYLDEKFNNPVCELNYKSDYQLLIAIVLSAQSTDKRVNSVTPILFEKYKTLSELRKADRTVIEEIIRPIGSFRKKASYILDIAKILDSEYGGMVPADRELLVRMPGVGRKTANVFLSEYYNFPAIAVDTHVERVSKRLGLCSESDSVLLIEDKLMKRFPKKTWAKLHLQLVLFGRYHCKAINPNCCECKLKTICGYGKKI